MSRYRLVVIAGAALLAASVAGRSDAAKHGEQGAKSEPPTPAMTREMMSEGLYMPSMNAARGRELFASKGCVVCHAINGVGGEHSPPLDASTMKRPMNPFEFAAKMWRGAEAMIYLQQEELGEQIELSGRELADIIAFAHDAGEQKKFSEDDIPERIKALMHHMEEAEPHEHEGGHESDKKSE